MSLLRAAESRERSSRDSWGWNFRFSFYDRPGSCAQRFSSKFIKALEWTRGRPKYRITDIPRLIRPPLRILPRIVSLWNLLLQRKRSKKPRLSDELKLFL